MRMAFALLGLALAGATIARAQDEGSGPGFVSPFPKGDVYKVQVIGDDLAEGLLYGLTEAFAGDGKVEVLKKSLTINGLLRPDFEDKLNDLQSGLSPEPAEIAVIMVGAWDRTPARNASGKKLQVGTAEWRAEYGQRADRLIKTLKQHNMAVYLVGLPNVRRPDFDEDAKMMNEILRERIYLNSFKYIDAYAGFADEQGGYSAYGPDLTGKMRLLREGDGVYFTAAGNRKLAHFVEKEIRRDVTKARAERNVPLAGSEAEQIKVRPPSAQAPASGAASPSAPQQSPSPTAQAAGAPAAPGWAPVTSPSAAATDQVPVDQKADNGKISLKMISQTGAEEVVTLEVVRPAISASVVALVTRRESSDKPSQMGHSLVDQVQGGLTMLSSITPSNASGSGRGLSPTQSPYYKVLMKGERLTPKKGRADDFTWPRAEAPVSQAAPPPGPAKKDAYLRTPPSSGSQETGAIRPPPARN